MDLISKNTKLIKIKFGDTLKRMKVYIYGGDTSFLTMTDLRKKIHNTFKFPADADFILTYVDEDGDVVTLFDDDDLSDALTQPMKVVKINVQLSNNKLGVDSYAQSAKVSKSVTVLLQQLREALQQQLLEALLQLPEFLEKYLNFCPPYFFEALSKIITKAVSVLGHLFDSIISKRFMNLSCTNVVLS